MNAYYVYTIADRHGVFGSKTVVPQQLGAQPIWEIWSFPNLEKQQVLPRRATHGAGGGGV